MRKTNVSAAAVSSGKNRPTSVESESTTTAKKTSQQPQKFDHYELIWQVAGDALSTTYAARREGVDGLLAVRIFNNKVRSEAQVRQIQQAAKRAAEITHPNAVTVYESGIAECGSPYVVTNLIEGSSLAEVLAAVKRLDVSRLLSIFAQIGDALCDAHSKQLVHGNLSPSKIVLVNSADQPDLVKVIDFGMPPDPSQSAFYVSPEQCLDRARVDARADIYSLGCLMFESLTGSPPFIGHRRSQAALHCLHELANQFSPDSAEHNALKLLDCIIIKCLQANPSKRFGSVQELMGALSMVSDCISDGKTRRLPKKAEKLLLFRFLDLFGRQIHICFAIYIALILFSAKFVSEIQLQKFIDQAQVAVQNANWSVAQSNWRLAIQEARSANKPQGLQADLHWALGDVYNAESAESPGTTKWLLSDATMEYEKALSYYEHGANNRSYAIALLRHIADLWIAFDDSKTKTQAMQTARLHARALFDTKRFTECEAFCRQYLSGHPDVQIAAIARDTEMRLAAKLPPERALPFLARAAYFSRQSSNSALTPYDLDNCIQQLNMFPECPATQDALALSSLSNGDLEAAAGHCRYTDAIAGALDSYFELKRDAISHLPANQGNASKAIDALTRLFRLECEAHGSHSQALAPTLAQLARAYISVGKPDLAAATYGKLFAMYKDAPLNSSGRTVQFAPTFAADSFTTSTAPDGTVTTDVDIAGAAFFFEADAFLYADTLMKIGHTGEAIRFLENRLLAKDGSLDTSRGLYIQLVSAYTRLHLKRQAHDALLELTNGQEAKPVMIAEPVRDLPLVQTNDPFAQTSCSHPGLRKGLEVGRYDTTVYIP